MSTKDTTDETEAHSTDETPLRSLESLAFEIGEYDCVSRVDTNVFESTGKETIYVRGHPGEMVYGLVTDRARLHDFQVSWQDIDSKGRILFALKRYE